jgi:riboflavin kinase/FMN adenylyltransferase
MEIVEGWSDVPAQCRGASLAIGNFDGVHRGHRAVIEAAQDAARPLGAKTGAMVFEPHPRKYFQPSKPLFVLTPLPRKLELFEKLGCDLTAVLPFDAVLANLSAEEFARDVLAEGFGISHATIGFDFFFGRGRGGNPQTLCELGQRFGFGVTVVEPKGGAGEIYSSTRIRELLAEGDVASAAEMLGHWWRVTGEVIGGAGRGAGLGFPTANIRLGDGQSLKHGIYAVRVHVEGQVLKGAAYLGTRPTFDSGPPLLETFLFDFDGDLYGKIIGVEFIAFVRGDAKFKSAEALSVQMAADCLSAKNLLEGKGVCPNGGGNGACNAITR